MQARAEKLTNQHAQMRAFRHIASLFWFAQSQGEEDTVLERERGTGQGHGSAHQWIEPTGKLAIPMMGFPQNSEKAYGLALFALKPST